jgi:hypothetical protein
LYNKPIEVDTTPVTDGKIAREEFAKHYGAYMEIMYSLCKGDFLKMNQIEKWETEKFLFLGEYLIRKKDVENKK